MAGIKISNLPAIVTPALSDIFPVVQGGITYQETVTQLQSLLGLNTVSVASVQNQTYTYAVDTGAANTYSATLSVAPLNYVAGQRFDVLIANTNTTTSTLNVNSLGAISIVRDDGTSLVGGDLVAGMVASFEYNGTTFQLLNPARRLLGTTTNDNAAAGYVGEFISATAVVGAVSLSTATPANITTISLTAGDWDVYGNVAFTSGGATVITAIVAGISSTSATFDTTPSAGAVQQIPVTFTTGGNPVISAGRRRYSLASTTTIYLLASAAFSASTLTGGGFIGARRVR